MKTGQSLRQTTLAGGRRKRQDSLAGGERRGRTAAQDALRERIGALENTIEHMDQGVSATALVTNKAARFTAPLLHTHDLWDYLDAVVCGDMLAQKKPHPLPVEHCLARFETAPERALLVGDSEVDVATARNAGVAVWAVSYGYHCGRLIGPSRPDRVIPTIRAVADAIAQTVSA